MPLHKHEQILKKFIFSKGENPVLFVGIGNVLRKDDGAGVFISRKIVETSYIRTLTVEVSIENYIGKINQLRPRRLVLVDCADLKMSPGSFRLSGLEKIEDLTFNTHNISLARLRDFFAMPAWLLGIQPSETDFGESLTLPVRIAAEKILQIINNQVSSESVMETDMQGFH
jgi:hydrogenase 3 maturation protease